MLSYPWHAISCAVKVKKLGVAWREAFKAAAITGIAQRLIKKNNIKLISGYCLLYDGLMGAVLKDKLGIPFAVTNFGEVYTRPDFYKKNIGIINYILDRASRVMSTSQYCANCYVTIGANPKVDVVYYGIDVAQFSSGSKMTGEVEQRLGITKGEGNILFVGRMVRDTGLDVFLNSIPLALTKNANLRFIVVGAKGAMSQQAIDVQSAYPNNVFVVINAPSRELAAYYFLADIVAAPTADQRPCMGMSIKEAMMAQKPVVATRSGGIPEAVVDGITGILIPPNNPQALADAIVKLTADKEKMAAMGQAGQIRAKELFDNEVTNKKVFDIFESIIS